MSRREPTMATLPANGCARCEWWSHRVNSPWGFCQLTKVERWYQAAACPEYEIDARVPDEIPLYL